uniref:Uncharacterized protein n=1 Tax=Rhizophora mucronata TaxID=61149 RepID=A0A2P2N8U8_RHIMU
MGILVHKAPTLQVLGKIKCMHPYSCFHKEVISTTLTCEFYVTME